MSVIKFRCWNGYKNEWQNSDPIIDGEGVVRVSEGCDVSQFTGFQDKNGKDIFEGDVLDRTGHRRRLVEWEGDAFVLKPLFLIHGKEKGKYRMKGFMKNKDVEVIGNVYENPELV